MVLLDTTYIRDICDYSFGDQSGAGFFCGYMKPANINNIEFMNKYRSLLGKKEYMTLFIDNIRLYRRDGIRYTAMEEMYEHNKVYKDRVVKEYFKSNDLLELCGQLTDMKFLIFTGFEDTPIDEFIFDKIPENVISIYASNAIEFGGKVKPIPYGIQRQLYPHDNRQQILVSMINSNIQPEKLLYINHSLGNNPERVVLNEMLKDKNWVTIQSPVSINSNDYLKYLENIKSHKFMVCPSGNAKGCECHRDWEVLYMRRVPVVKRSKYLEKIFEDIPVLFVDNFSDISEELLLKNDHLYQSVQNFDLGKLDIEGLYNKIINEVNNNL